MPRAVPIGPETGLQINRKAGHANQAPQDGHPSDLFGPLNRLAFHLAASPDQPAQPSTGEYAEDNQLRPEQRPIIQREFPTG